MFKAPFVFKSLGLGLGTLMLSACGSSSSSITSNTSAELEVAIEQVIDNTIMPASAAFKAQIQVLDDSAEFFCSDGNINEANLLTVQANWVQANDTWFQLLPFNFGPMITSIVIPNYYYIDSFRVNGVDSTAIVRTEINNLLSSVTGINDDLFTTKESNKVGLLALEVALFENAGSGSTASSDVATEFVDAPRKCQILTGYTAELLRRANIIDDGWTADYRSTGSSYRELLLSGELENVSGEDGSAATTKIVLAVQNYYDYLANRSVSSSVAQLSNSIWDSLDLSIDITQELLEGKADTNVSLFNIMNNTDGNTLDVESIKANFITIHAAIDEANSTDLQAAAKALDNNFKVDVTTGLDIDAGLSFSDGD